MNEPPVAISVIASDKIMQAAAALEGVSDALAYRAAAEGDEMLALLSGAIDAQIDILREAIR